MLGPRHRSSAVWKYSFDRFFLEFSPLACFVITFSISGDIWDNENLSNRVQRVSIQGNKVYIDRRGEEKKWLKCLLMTHDVKSSLTNKLISEFFYKSRDKDWYEAVGYFYHACKLNKQSGSEGEKKPGYIYSGHWACQADALTQEKVQDILRLLTLQQPVTEEQELHLSAG